MLRKIVTNRRELSIPTEPIVSAEEVADIIVDLEESFSPLANKGFGLAANQIGIPKSVALMKVGGKRTILINPKVIEKDERIKFSEGCFSFPGLTVLTDRYAYIKIENGLNKEIIEFRGIEAVVCQHELGHLQGKTIFDFKHKAR